MTDEEKRAFVVRANASNVRKAAASRLEKSVWAVLDALGVVYETSVLIGRYIADIYVPEKKLVIECDGTYWHGRPGAAEKDAHRDAYMHTLGLTVLRLPERDIKSGTAVNVVVNALAC